MGLGVRPHLYCWTLSSRDPSHQSKQWALGCLRNGQFCLSSSWYDFSTLTQIRGGDDDDNSDNEGPSGLRRCWYYLDYLWQDIVNLLRVFTPFPTTATNFVDVVGGSKHPTEPASVARTLCASRQPSHPQSCSMLHDSGENWGISFPMSTSIVAKDTHHR